MESRFLTHQACGFSPDVKEIIINAPVSDEQIELFLTEMHVTNSIEAISFQLNATIDTLRALSTHLKSPQCRVTSLAITGLYLDEEWNKILSDVLCSNNKSVTTLKFEYNNSSQPLDVIFAYMQTSKVLECLSLRGNNLSRNECVQLTDVLKTTTSLRKLDLAYCQLEDPDCFMISDALKNNKTLKVLDLSHNYFSAKGLAWGYFSNIEHVRCTGHEAIKELLIENATLEDLDITGCDTDYEDLQHICEALERNTSLTRLHMETIYDVNSQLKLLEEMLQYNRTLIDLEPGAEHCSDDHQVQTVEGYIRRNIISRSRYHASALLHNIMRSGHAILLPEMWIEVLSHVFPDIDNFKDFAWSICKMYSK